MTKNPRHVINDLYQRRPRRQARALAEFLLDCERLSPVSGSGGNLDVSVSRALAAADMKDKSSFYNLLRDWEAAGIIALERRMRRGTGTTSIAIRDREVLTMIASADRWKRVNGRW